MPKAKPDDSSDASQAGDDFEIQTPGEVADSAASGAPANAQPSPAPDEAPATVATPAPDFDELATLRDENALLEAKVAELERQLAGAAAKPVEPPRLIGQDWSRMTAAQAKAAGCTQRVLCSDGYYIPG